MTMTSVTSSLKTSTWFFFFISSATLVTSCYVYPTDTRDPCRDKRCSFGAQCVPSLDGLTARCQCPDRCVSYGDSVGSTPICATDNNDYANTCEMRRAACREMKDIEKKYDGKCDPCDGFECQASQVCKLNEDRQPLCRCNTACSNDFAPVCGSDGRTYSNDCFMLSEACKHGKDIRMLFRGECPAAGNSKSHGVSGDKQNITKGPVNLCASLTCGAGEECHVDRNGKARCACTPATCERIVRPVCGSNGKTYDNACELKRKSCLEKIGVTVKHIGECKDRIQTEDDKMMSDAAASADTKPCQEGPCSHHKCQQGALCTVKNGRPVCQCPFCSEAFKPVCGSDLNSYANECKLIAENCLRMTNITVKHTGRCDPCDGVKCSFGEFCVDGKCSCQAECSLESSQDELLCASDGVTYTSACAMRVAACTKKVNIDVIYSGKCEEFSGYGDMTGYAALKCEQVTCLFGAKCQLDTDGQPSCSCNFNCPAVRSPVCSSDGRTYGNECEMKESSCRKQEILQIQLMENCQDIVEELCDGNTPLFNPLTGKNYDCEGGYETCPAGSYCHKLTTTAGCCKEEQTASINCQHSKYGCCPEEVTTSALGPDGAGCPSICQCNPLGSLLLTCEPVKRQCLCKLGVGGVRCDRCEPTYWGLAKISDGNSGCLPCGCNIFGSVRQDCEQMTGKCVCKPGFGGQKCNICPNGKEVRFFGCSDRLLYDGAICSEENCRYGGHCKQSGHNVSECVCPASCPVEREAASAELSSSVVCGSDRMTYQSVCRVNQFACRLQKEITVLHLGPCRDSEVKLLRTSVASEKTKFHRIIDERQMSGSKDRPIEKKGGSNKLENETKKLLITNDGPLSFNGQVYQKYSVETSQNQNKFEMSFRALSKNGLLLLQRKSQSSSARHDFLAIAVRDGRIETSFNLGKDLPTKTLPTARSIVNVSDGKWHTLILSRENRVLQLSVDYETPVLALSTPGANLLDTDGLLWIGGSETFVAGLPTAYDVGFVGCIDYVKINDIYLNIVDHKDVNNDSLPICLL